MIEANRIEKAKVRAANRTLEMNTAQRLIFVVWKCEKGMQVSELTNIDLSFFSFSLRKQQRKQNHI